MPLALRIVAALVYLLFGIVLTTGMVLVHLPTRIGRRAIRDTANAVLARTFRGRLHIHRIDSIDLLGSLRASGITLHDPRGRLVAEEGTLESGPVSSLWGGLLRFPGAAMPSTRLRLRVLRLLPGDRDAPSIADAFELRHPPRVSPTPGPPPPPFWFPHLELSVDVLESELGGVRVIAHRAHARGEVLTEPVTVRAALAPTQVTSSRTPVITARGSFDWRARFVPDPHGQAQRDVGRMHAVADLTGPGIACHLEWNRENEIDDLRLSHCYLSAELLNQLTAQPIGLGVQIISIRASHAPHQPWRIEARTAIENQPIELRAVLGPTDQMADITVHQLDLSRLRRDFPVTVLDGTVHVERHGDRFILDTSALTATVAQVPVPPVQAHGRIVGTRLVLDQAVSTSMGLSGRGEIDLFSPRHDGYLEVHLHTDELGTLPLVQHRARGSIVADLSLERRDGRLHGHFDARVQNLRAPGTSIHRGTASGTFDLVQGRPHLAINVSASGWTAPNVGLLDVTGRVYGNPLEQLQGTLHAQARTSVGRRTRTTYPRAHPEETVTRLDGNFRARIHPDAIHVELSPSPVILRGAEGHIEGDITIPLRRDRLAGRMRITTRDGGIADVAIRGTNVTGQFHRFPLAWVGRALGTTEPLAGTLEGDVDTLLHRTGRTHAALRWTHGRLPSIGEFDLEITADHTRDVSEFRAQLTFGSDRAQRPPAEQQVLRAIVHAVPPRDLNDLQGWLRGMRDARAEGRNLPLRLAETVLPPGAWLAGKADADLTLTRATPEAPLELLFGVDIRNVQLGMDAAALVPGAVRQLVRRSSTVRPLTDLLRLRWAVCTRIEREDLSLLPTVVHSVLAREVGEPVISPPNRCTKDDVVTREPLIYTAGSLDGPWHIALRQFVEEYQQAWARGPTRLRDIAPSTSTRRALRASPVDLTFSIGPIRSEQWPFTPTMETLVPALARPSVPGVANATVHVSGTLFSPAIALEGHLQTSGIEALVSRDALEVTLTGTVAPLRQGDWILGMVGIQMDARAMLMAHTPRGRQEAGTATIQLRTHGEMARLLDPSEGLRAAVIDRFQIDTSRLQIGRLRWARANTMDGLLTFTLRETGDPITPIAGNATVTDFRVRHQHPSSASINAFVRNVEGVWEIQACATTTPTVVAPPICDPDAPVDSAPPGGLRAAMTLPLEGDLLRFDPEWDGLRVAVAGQQYRLETISPLLEIPPVIRIGGAFTGQLAWTARAPRALRGRFQIEDGLLDLERIGQPGRNIVVDIDAAGRRAAIHRLHVQLGAGTIDGSGGADFTGTGDHVATVRLRAQANRLPAIQEGNVYGYVSGRADFEGTFRTSGMRGRVTVHDASVTVPTRPARTLQEVDPHRDVFVIGETHIATSAPSRPYPIDVDYTILNPVWLRRDDFEIAVHSSGHLHYDPAGLSLTGEVEQAFRQSYFVLFGKRFYFDRISIQFDGSLEFNPILDVAAHYDSPSTGRIYVYVTGRRNTPDIRFAADRYPTASQSELLALLVLGRRETRTVAESNVLTQTGQAETAALLTGLMLGIASDVVQQQIREGQLQIPWLQRIILEPGAQGLSPRVGAALTPASGFYVEGTFGAMTPYSGAVVPQSGAQAQEGRLFVEYSLSDHISVAGTATTSQRFGLDVFFSP